MSLLRRGSKIDRRLIKLLGDFELPSFSTVAAEALQQLAEPGTDLEDVAITLRHDPGLSTHLLRLVNSASYGLRNPVGNVSQAMGLLGRNQVESILISKAVRGALPAPTSSAFDRHRFWSAAAGRAAVASGLAAIIDRAHQAESFTAALLQDMAIPMLLERSPGYDELLMSWHDGTTQDLETAEQAAFGFSHSQIGGWMAEQWNFPPTLCAAISDHHDDGQPDQSALPASQLVSSWREVDEDGSAWAGIVAASAEAINRSPADTASLLDRLRKESDEVARLFV